MCKNILRTQCLTCVDGYTLSEAGDCEQLANADAAAVNGTAPNFIL